MDAKERKIYSDRRRRFLKQMGEGLALIFTAPQYIKSHDTDFEFHPDTYFYYLTGFNEPEAALLLNPKAKEEIITLYMRERDTAQEVWTGRRLGVERAIESLGVDAAYPFKKLRDELPPMLRKLHRFFYGMGVHKPYDDLVNSFLTSYRPNLRGGDRPIQAIQNPFVLLNEMRSIKEEHELNLMQQACDISAKAYLAAFKAIKHLKHEYEVEALIEYEFRRHGGLGTGFSSIVASGDNATILHYDTNNDPIQKEALLLMDTGCLYNYYSSDVTRTVPASGKFSKPQRELYDLVLNVQRLIIKKIRPGVRYQELQDTTREELAKGVIELGILKGSLEEVLKSEAFNRFYPHRIGHWLGLDVHDVGDYFEADGTSKKLQPGMVITVEPGLYIPADDKRAPAGYRGIGIRIEDNIVVTTTGNRNLTEAIPKDPEVIEQLMQG